MNQQDYHTKLGQWFGYPACCIAQWVQEVMNVSPSMRSNLRARMSAGKASGFMPCDECANALNEHRITLNALISGRVCETPFPQAHGRRHEEAFKQWVRGFKEGDRIKLTDETRSDPYRATVIGSMGDRVMVCDSMGRVWAFDKSEIEIAK